MMLSLEKTWTAKAPSLTNALNLDPRHGWSLRIVIIINSQHIYVDHFYPIRTGIYYLKPHERQF
ncbi:hypothetical protein [Paraglaciecola sp. 20A4]|uniref:hypothetical protein n=1 Tax=Paraglaciecola sp. 20A4 TaxID=2687288 RepID=UPI00140E7C8C|nr:hypothetical protein [Paraglaciecola sp. 20A4]